MQRNSSDSFQLVLNGGLGNQLFGYAAGKSIEKETGLVCKFIKPGSGDRAYELDNFGINAKPGSSTKSPPLGRSLMNRLINKLNANEFRYRETSFTFDRRFYTDPAGKTLYGYFQSYRYFENIKSQIFDLPNLHVPFSSDFKVLEEELAHEDFIAVHVRRGDYLGKENYHGLTSEKYFYLAMLSVLKINAGAKFVVFSDSIELARKAFPYAIKYVSGENLFKPSENLMLMSRMGGIIGSNSSLSWWAGFFNQRTKINCFPDPWFANQQLDTRDLLPPDWKKIPSGISLIENAD
jgi:hypothetical protein